MDRVNQYTGSSKRTTSNYVGRQFDSGPFIALVKSHLDSKFMGMLEVELLTKSQSGNLPDNPFPVAYLPPFAGQTSYDGVRSNDGDQYTQKSYGMWFVPPDVGSRVLVIFAEGYGFWIGCVPDEYMNMSMPAPDVSTTYNTEDGSKKLPVAEYNKKTQDTGKNDPTKFRKPVYSSFRKILENQGLLEDETRGLTSSSARRELPSSVFGISTPGPYNRKSHRFKYGNSDQQVFHDRLGGSSLVFDDGDPSKLRKGAAKETPFDYADRDSGDSGGDDSIPHNEMLRLKTRTGHQIIMHNAEDLIYICNAQGTSWVELTANGKIDIYSQDSISVHSENDLNFTADRDINLEAGRDFNLKANNDINIENSVGNFQLIVANNSKITTATNLDISTGSDNKITSRTSKTEINSSSDNNFTAGGTTNISSGGQHIETASEIHMNGPSAAQAATSQQAKPLETFQLPGIVSIMKRVPQHEPWLHHENLSPMEVNGEKTDRTKSGSPVETELKDTGDTFRKGS
jgi:hypothetical protein